ncbi:hypothetical protein, partial [Sinomicrobium weinanense]
GQLNLSTINGEIDLEMKNTSLTLETIHGNVFARENLELETEERVVGHKMSGSTDQATNSLKLKTINGNIYLR